MLKRYLTIYQCALILLILLYSGFATAEETGTKSEIVSRYWITNGFYSYHANRKANYNENNTGIGFEYRFSNVGSFAIGHYKNSVRRDTTYAQYVYTPLELGRLRLGGAVGIVDGYPYLRNGKFAPVFLPVATMDFKVFDRKVGLNAVYIPSLIPHVDSAFAVQFKFAIDN